jgi:trehalose 6-phosphate phosphatase
MYWRDAISSMLRALVEKSRLGLITDMDGTISPIVEEPDAARITPRSRELLQALQTRLALVAVVSGRAAADIRDRVGLPGLVYVGNHGMERWNGDHIETSPEAAAFRPALESAMAAVRAQLAPGMRIEDKGVTLSIHYRQTADPETAAAQFRPLIETISARSGLRCFQGRMVFELRPPLDVNKGTIFSNLVTEYALDAAVYLGDDTTDADALIMARQMRQQGQCYSLGIGVESEDMPVVVRENADLLAAGVDDVESLLVWLFEARSASST